MVSNVRAPEDDRKVVGRTTGRETPSDSLCGGGGVGREGSRGQPQHSRKSPEGSRKSPRREPPKATPNNGCQQVFSSISMVLGSAWVLGDSRKKNQKSSGKKGSSEWLVPGVPSMRRMILQTVASTVR